MTVARSSRRARRDAPALRFLLLCGGGWVALRVLASWNPALPPPSLPASPWAPPSQPDERTTSIPALEVADGAAADDGGRLAAAAEHREDARAEAVVPAAMGDGFDRHDLRLALMARLLSLPIPERARAAVPTGAAWLPSRVAERAAPGSGTPFWMKRDLSDWSLSSWLFLRQGSATAPGAIAAAGELGGSQAGLRVAYGFGDAGRVRAYGRATIATDRPGQRDLAFGVAFAPVARLPIDIAVEQRVAAGREGRTALAAMIAGGVGDVALPGGFRLEAYGQAGVVGVHRRDGFVDAAIVVDHPIGTDERAPLRLGALAATAAQPGASRVDVGPRLTLRLPDVGQGSRIAVDWRQRIAGDARPESGLAVTLAADF